jgi:hypothetical protein
MTPFDAYMQAWNDYQDARQRLFDATVAAFPLGEQLRLQSKKQGKAFVGVTCFHYGAKTTDIGAVRLRVGFSQPKFVLPATQAEPLKPKEKECFKPAIRRWGR